MTISNHIYRKGTIRALGLPNRREESVRHGEYDKPRSYRYKTLMKVSFENSFYNGNDNQCTSFTVYPTIATHELIKKLGLLIRYNSSSFEVLYDEEKENLTQNLIKYLLRKTGHESHTGEFKYTWKRLSFILSLEKDTEFLNFTAIPTNINPSEKNLYYSNAVKNFDSQCNEEVDVILHRQPSGGLKTVSSQYGVDVSHKVEYISVYNLSFDTDNQEKPVLRIPRCIPYSLAQIKTFSNVSYDEMIAYCEEHGIDWKNKQYCSSTITPPDPDKPKHCFVCATTLFVDFSKLEEGHYTIVKEDASGQALGKAQTVLYTEEYPVPLIFLDLMFSQPAANCEGVYPVTELSGTPESPHGDIDTVDYSIQFNARKTFWQYYIVPKNGFDTYSNLSIRSLEDDGITFEGPVTEHLNNGSKAHVFTSNKKIDLLEQTTYRFELKGKHHLSERTKTLYKPLPGADSQQLFKIFIEGQKENASKTYVYI